MFSCNLPPALLAEWPGFFTCYCGNTGVERIPKNKSQHRKSTLEKKILPPFQQGFEPATFQSRVRCSNHWAIPAPCWMICWSLLYSAILRSHVILHEWIAIYSAFLNIHRSGVLTALARLVPHETAAISARSVYTIQPCTMSLHAKPHT